LVAQIASLWPVGFEADRFVVLTGGEPLLQVDGALIDALHAAGFFIAVESNGTQAAPVGASGGIDWVCVSPKLSGDAWVLRSGNELKLVWPQASAQAPGHKGFDLAAIERLPFEHFYLQAMDGAQQTENLQSAIAQCLARPRWKLSVQTHKALNIR
jgi:organic radical activating enzyme